MRSYQVGGRSYSIYCNLGQSAHIIRLYAADTKQIIAALEYMADHGIVHHRIDCQSIRVCGKSGKVFLSDFEKATLYRRQSLPNTDFEALGLVLIRTMNKNHLGQLDVNSVREQRRENKLYGIHDAEYWSHCKSLIDFLDDLFIVSKSASLKLQKKVKYTLI